MEDTVLRHALLHRGIITGADLDAAQEAVDEAAEQKREADKSAVRQPFREV